MNTREKAEWLAQHDGIHISGIGLIRYEQAVKEVAQAYLDQQWIPVSERLPESGCYVLCCVNDSLPWVAMYHEGKKLFRAHEGENTKPTHWMPLSEPPESE